MKLNKKIFLLIGLGLAALTAAVVTVSNRRPPSPSEKISKQEALYQCSMHPTIVSNKPDNCPICGMRLTLVESSPGHSHETGKKKPLYYRHPMRPDVTSTEPAKDEMGMDYMPVYEEERAGDGVTVPGHAEAVISPERRQLIGMRTAEAKRIPLSLTVRAVGRVAHDPDLYVALAEYRGAAAALEDIGESAPPEAREKALSLVRSAEFKLKLLGFDPSKLEEFLKTDPAAQGLLLPGDSAWVYADVFEYETGLVKPGQTAQITTPALPGTTLEGEVKTVDPILNSMTRTVKLRILVPNTQGVLKPEMYLDAAIQVSLGTKLAVPQEAVFDTGQRQVIFVDKGEGVIEPREVRVGREAGGYYEVLEGLAEGERIVSSANFLVDSESRLRAAAKGAHRH